jgi:hypothetical protein
VWTVKNVPAEIPCHTDVRSNANFEASAKLAHTSAFFLIVETRFKSAKYFDGPIIPSAKRCAATGPDVRRET